VTEESGEAGFITALPKFGMALCEGHASQAQVEIVEADPEPLRLLTIDID
jgi:hypothetical protein